ncbi:hypothetical protein KDA_07510 [Dictyobacter alpinus]|uniref:Uncharacterized protein n=1 Tax=Dictyobacter alpinus TaxID=2014873 RepID=A0A402B1T7_9CHLR|nr:hypothetical protein [Dictyobacter alpinus]GCE25267.1 hypothetical protein KDA_07510 [Dictyobacter alpinus]
MGVERSVTRWYIQRQLILDELAQLEAQVSNSQENSASATAPVDTAQAPSEEIMQKVAMTRAKLKALGHCPKPMMG